MARAHARVFARIWADKDFRLLSEAGQRMYLLLLSQADLNYAGVLPLTERRWANLCEESTSDGVEGAVEELTNARYVVVDYDTEELLVRTFIRNDELWKQPKVLAVALREALATASRGVRAALADELERVRGLLIENKCAEKSVTDVEATIKDLIGTPDGTPRDTPAEALAEPLARPTPNPSGGVRVYAHAAPAPTTSTTTSTGYGSCSRSRGGDLRGERPESDRAQETTPTQPPTTQRPPEHCPKHPDGTDDPCRACGRARTAAEQWDKTQHQTRQQAIRDCPSLCDAEGWRWIDPTNKGLGTMTGPTAHCDHQPTDEVDW